MKIAIGNDHAAPALKKEIQEHLQERGIEVLNFGTDTADRVNYAEYAEKVAKCVVRGEADAGILICGTGLGMSIAANKVKGIRAAAVSDPVSARLAKEHNNANILCFGARIVGGELAKGIVDAWLDAEFQGGRHLTRINQIRDIEEKGTCLSEALN